MAAKQTTRASARKSTSRAQSRKQTPAGSGAAVDLAVAVATEEIEKVARIYVDDPRVARVPTPSGTLATVQREKRANGSLGEYMLAEVRAPKQKGQPESITRYSIAKAQELLDALGSAGVKLIVPPTIKK